MRSVRHAHAPQLLESKEEIMKIPHLDCTYILNVIYN